MMRPTSGNQSKNSLNKTSPLFSEQTFWNPAVPVRHIQYVLHERIPRLNKHADSLARSVTHSLPNTMPLTPQQRFELSIRVHKMLAVSLASLGSSRVSDTVSYGSIRIFAFDGVSKAKNPELWRTLHSIPVS
jgi:hypothetical protein